MTSTTLLAAAGLDIATAGLFAYVATLILRRLPRDRDHSTEAFALFWFGIGLANALAAILELVAARGDPGLPLTFAISNTRFGLGLASFAGIIYYLLYVYTGRRGARGPVLVGASAAFLLIQVWLTQSAPIGTDVSAWRVDLAFANEAVTPLYGLLVLVFFGPPLVCTAGYLLLLRRVETPTQIRRARLVSASLVVYFSGLILGYLSPGWPWWGLVESLLGIGAALAAIVAFQPAEGPRPARARIDAGLLQRVHELV